MVDITTIGSKAGAIGSKTLVITFWVVIGLIVIGVIVGLLIWFYRRKKWNLKVTVKLPRAGKSFITEKAKGHYDIKAGIVDIKRKKLKPVGMKPFDVRTFLQGIKGNELEVIQIAPNDYLPVVPTSYEKVVDDDGNEHCVFEIKADLQKRKTWKTYMERAAKNRFTLVGFLDKHWRSIEIGIITFIIFLGFAVLWMRMPKLCG